LPWIVKNIEGGKSIMTSRDRVLKAINHQEPDRVPVDLGGHRSSGIMAIAYNNLKKFLGISSGDIYVYDFIQQLAIIEPEVLDRFGVDVIELGRGFSLEPACWRDWVLPDNTPCKIPAFIQPVKKGNDWQIYDNEGTLITIQKEGCLYFEQTIYPLASSDDTSFDNLNPSLDKVMWCSLGSPPAPLGNTPNDLKEKAEGAKALRQSTERAIVGLFGGNLLEIGQMLFRNDNFLMMLAGEPLRAHRLLDQLVELHLDNLEKFMGAVGPYIDIINFGDDLGMQMGPQISPKMYKEFFQPRHQFLWSTAKKLGNVKVMLHSCGDLYSLLPSIIEAGLDIVNPVQTTCKEMDPVRLKREFGKDMVFWGGGCNTRNILPYGTPEQVREDVRSNVKIFAPGGGFVFQQIHNVMADIPPENIVAMLDAVNS
jgi:uroporphyrinogen decarboxylase